MYICRDFGQKAPFSNIIELCLLIEFPDVLEMYVVYIVRVEVSAVRKVR